MEKTAEVGRKSSLCFLKTTHQAQQLLPNNAVGKQIAGLNADKVTKHIVPDKGGYWQVAEKTD